MESKASQRSGGFGLRDRESSGSGGITGTAGFDDDVFEMQFNDEAIYEDGEGGIEQAEEAREMGAEGDGDEQFDDDDEVVSALSQERTRRSSMDLTQYAASAPIQVPVDAANWASLRPEEEGLDAREPSLARPECLEDIARSMRDISDRMVDDHTKVSLAYTLTKYIFFPSTFQKYTALTACFEVWHFYPEKYIEFEWGIEAQVEVVLILSPAI